jgi:flagellar hook-basal body complex protein FliE
MAVSRRHIAVVTVGMALVVLLGTLMSAGEADRSRPSESDSEASRLGAQVKLIAIAADDGWPRGLSTALKLEAGRDAGVRLQKSRRKAATRAIEQINDLKKKLAATLLSASTSAANANSVASEKAIREKEDEQQKVLKPVTIAMQKSRRRGLEPRERSWRADERIRERTANTVSSSGDFARQLKEAATEGACVVACARDYDGQELTRASIVTQKAADGHLYCSSLSLSISLSIYIIKIYILMMKMVQASSLQYLRSV